MADAAFAVAADPAAARQDALARHPAGRLGEPGDIASLAAWLASDDAGFATGQCYTLDGGMTAASPLNPGLF
jgi:2-keto-3-deoxy-L-fuconate dehydrogenase